MKLPLISIIIPVYNMERYISNCLDSLINSTYKNLEILLIDDGSKDNSPQICDEYAAKDSRIKVVHKPNGGVSSARNVGIDMMSGDYVHFLDPDDWMAIDTYKNVIGHLQRTNADVCFINTTHEYADGTPSSLRTPDIGDGLYNRSALLKYIIGFRGFNNIWTSYYFSSTNKIMKSSIIKDENITYKFDENFAYLEDGIFVMSILHRIETGYIDTNGYYHRRMHNESAMGSFSEASLASKMLVGYQAMLNLNICKTNPLIQKHLYEAYYHSGQHYLRVAVSHGYSVLTKNILDAFRTDSRFLREACNIIYRNYSDEREKSSSLWHELKKCKSTKNKHSEGETN